MHQVSIVVPIYINNSDIFYMTKFCFEQLQLNTKQVETEIIIVDDCSPNVKLRDMLQHKYFPGFKWVLNSKNRGFATSVNRGMSKATKDLILLLNNDVRIEEDLWLFNMVGSLYKNKFDLTSPNCGALDKNNNYITYADRKKVKTHFEYCLGWCLLMKKEVINTIGLLPTDFSMGYWEDTLYSYVIKKHGKFKSGVSKGIGIKHLEHRTFTSANYNLTKEYLEKRQIYLDLISGKKPLRLPKIEDYTDDTKF